MTRDPMTREMTHANPLEYLSLQLEDWRKAGTHMRLRQLQSPCEPVSRFDGREVINLASNNYLGLANDRRLVEAAINATKKYGAGSGAVRTISGTMSLHME
ncbi:MAG: 8-amino-7-oxononanoate synthase, partial [Bryobacteraceae bacterium]